MSEVAVWLEKDKKGRYYLKEPTQAAAKRKLDAALEEDSPRLMHIIVPALKPKPKEETKNVQKKTKAGASKGGANSNGANTAASG